MTAQMQRQADERIALAEEQAARAAAEETTRRSTFLAEASTVLASSLDYEAAFRSLARLIVPFLADLSAISRVNDVGQLGPTELVWTSPLSGIKALTLAGLDTLPAPVVDGIGRVLATRKADVLEGSGAWPPTATGTGDAAPDFDWKDVAIFPLLGRGRTLGVMTLAQGRHFSPGELALAQDLAGRAAIAMDNAWLFRSVELRDRRKNEFLAMLGHELRNPLAAICNAVHILQTAGRDASVGNWTINVIDRQVQQLVRLVDDLLDASRITQGKIRLQMKTVAVAAIVQQAVEMSRPLLEARRQELSLSVLSEPLYVKGDLARLAQVVANLLNNAAKYTGEGGRVWLSAKQEEGEFVLRVRDSGMGIPPEMLAEIFDLFTQGSHGLDRSQGGLGIGLTLVRHLVEMHGGSVQAFSAGLNMGSEFVVRLPALGEAETESPSANGSDRSIRHPVPCRILVVDDNADAAISLATLLGKTGHDVQIAQDGPRALQTAQDFQPDIILLDIGLPGMDGYEVAQRVRQLPQLANVQLVAVTGYSPQDDPVRSAEARFDRYLVKPLDPQALPEMLASLVIPKQ
jgi:signal transduction histidine kinase/CheY-like chemotaxis protein